MKQSEVYGLLRERIAASEAVIACVRRMIAAKRGDDFGQSLAEVEGLLRAYDEITEQIDRAFAKWRTPEQGGG